MKYFDLLSKLDAQARFLGLISTLLAVALLLMSFTIYSLYSKKSVIVLPPKVDKEFWVSGDTLSTSYLEQVGYFIADRIMSVSPQNVDRSLDAVKPFFTTDPDKLKALDEVFIKIAQTIKENDYYQSFYPLRFYVDKKGNSLVIEGVVRKMAGMQYIGEERKRVEIKFIIKNGRFFVESIEVT